jgi:hypothetical protein
MNSATEVGISFYELLGVAVFIVGVLWALGKLNMRQFATSLDEKFKSGRIRIDTLEASIGAKFTASDQRIDDRFKTIDTKLMSFDPLHGEIARIDMDVMTVRLEMSEKFVRSDRLQHLDDKITRLFGEVFDKLDSKADKAMCDRVHKQ